MSFISPWTDAKVLALEKLWESGASATLIADELSKDGSKITRNSVIGKVHRLGLTREKPIPNKTVRRKRINGSRTRITNSSRPRPAPKAPTMRPHHLIDEVRLPDPKNRVPLLMARDHHCRAIVDYEGGLKEKAICCGETTPWIALNGIKRRSSWCNYHRKLYLTPPKPR